jgi:AcrR family transcriptional regulator
MPDEIPDRRVKKTLQLLQNALIELIPEKGYDAVTIQEILDRADVGRSTFYAHFENKDEVFEQRNRQLIDRQAIEGRMKSEDQTTPNLPFKLLLFIEDNRYFFKALLGKQGKGLLNQPVYDYLFTQAHQHITLLIPGAESDARKLDIIVHYYVNAFVGVLIWWLEQDLPISSQELGDLLKQLTLPGLREVLR